MINTVILTGASSGLGREIAQIICDHFPDTDEIWLISRRAERLASLSEKLTERYRDLSAVPIPLDLSDSSYYEKLKGILAEKSPRVSLLINCAGTGFLGSFEQSVGAEQQYMIDVNVSALTGITHAVLPYMPDGARIVNISSISSFAPNPRLTVYSASKHYVKAFSRGLCYELRDRGISVTAVCPGPMATEFVDVGRISGRSKNFESLPYTDPEKAASAALKAAKNRRSVVSPGMFFKVMHVLCKVLPTAYVMRFTKV